METKLHHAPRPDRMDLMNLDAVLASRVWQCFEDKIDEMILAHQHTCERSERHEETLRSQGALGALRRVKDLPEILRREVGKK